MNLSGGNIRLSVAIVFFSFLTSCVFIRSDKPLNPRLLFTVGSDFLQSAESVALKGDIDYRDGDQYQSGSFQLIMNHGDSLAMIVEGPLNIDVFRLIIADQTAYAWDRDSDSWRSSPDNDKLFISDYGIESLSPDRFGYYVFPQFYVNRELHLDPEKMTLSSGGYLSYIERSGNETAFSVFDNESNLAISYGKRKDLGNGFYPSFIQISSPGGQWRILMEIKKIRVNPGNFRKAWDRN